MKTRFNLFFRLMLVALSISIITPAWAQADKDFYVVKGVVKDKMTNKILEYANISITGTNIGTVANKDGEFSIKIKHDIKAESIEVSRIGYKTEVIPVTGVKMDKLVVYLTPKENILEAITILGKDPAELVQEAIDKIGDNYSNGDNLLSGFYRETIKKRSTFVNVAEAIVEIYKTKYNDQRLEGDLVQVYKGRRIISPKMDDTVLVKLLGGPNLSIYIDAVKNPDLMLTNMNMSDYYYRMELPVMIDDRPHYVVSFEPQVVLPYPLYFGKYYIDRETLTFSRVEFSLSMDDKSKATQMILKKKPFSLRFKPEEVSFMVNYKRMGDKSYLNYVRSELRFKCDWKRRLFSTNYTIVSETVVTKRSDKLLLKAPRKYAFNDASSLSDKVDNFYDENFWEDYNIIEPEQSLESAVNKLRKSIKN